MPADDHGDPWPGSTYRGFADVSPADERRRRRPPTTAMVGAGVAAALLLGLVFGFFARPQLSTAPRPVTPAAAPPEPASVPADVEVAPPPAAQVPITIKPAPKPAPLRSKGPLQVLPPQMARAAAPAPRPVPRAPAAPPSPALIGSGPYFSGGAAETPPTDAAAPAAAPAQASASFDCASARPGAEQMVCADPDLAAADREMARAYRRALRTTSAPNDLRTEQHDWMVIREDAARHSQRALASVYAQRIGELNQMASAASPSGPEDDEASEDTDR